MSTRRQFGSVRRLPSGRWQVRYWGPNGHAHTETFALKGDASRHLARVQADIDRGEWRDPELGRQSFEHWADHWWRTAANLRPSTRDGYAYVLRRFLRPAFGHLPLVAITPILVREWIAELSATELSPATVRKAYTVLRRILQVAVESDVLVRNPCAGVKAPAESRREMRFLTPDEVATLVEAMDKRYRALVLLACYGGLRWGELAALRRGRVDTLRRNVMVVEQVQELDDGTQFWGPPKSAAGLRTVPLPRLVSDALADDIGTWALPGADGLVFPSPQGAVLRNGLFHRRFWAPAIARAGFDGLRIHDMRHTAVGLAIATGAHAKALQARFGHASISVTLNTYGHLLPGQDEAIADALDDLARPAKARPDAAVRPMKSLR